MYIRTSETKSSICARGDQQAYGIDGPYSPVLKVTEVRLMTAIAPEHRCNISKADTKQVFLYGDLKDDEPIYITPPDSWLEPIPEGHVVQLLRAVYETVQAAR